MFQQIEALLQILKIANQEVSGSYYSLQSSDH